MAVNPHAETYQGKTQFSGPVKAGTRWNGANDAYVGLDDGANPIAVSKLANAGYVVCSQSCAIVEATAKAEAVDINIPALSMLISIQAIVTVAWTGGSKTLQVGAQPLGTFQGLTAATVVDAIGVYDLLPTASASVTGRWKNVNSISGHPDGEGVDVFVDSSDDGVGRAIVTVNYIPGLNLL